MTRLNRDAAEILLEVSAGQADGDAAAVHAVTDITGFGLLGHAREMALGSGVSFSIDHARLEYLPGALEAARDGFLAGGLKNNREFLEGCVGFAKGVPEEVRHL